MPVSMFTTKIERLNACASRATSPSATTIDGSVIISGMSPATTDPKTRSRTISAAGRPIRSSPCWRSLSESALKSRSIVFWPVTEASNPGSASARSTAATTWSMPESDASTNCTIVARRSCETSAGSRVSR